VKDLWNLIALGRTYKERGDFALGRTYKERGDFEMVKYT
jgi:hypothetical protein